MTVDLQTPGLGSTSLSDTSQMQVSQEMTPTTLSIPPISIAIDQPLYTIDMMKSPTLTTANAMAIVSSVAGSVVTIDQDTNLVANTNGFFSTPLTLTGLVDASLSTKKQIVNASNTTTSIDLTQGTYIELNQTSNTTITFTNFPFVAGGIATEIRIKRIQGSASSNFYTLDFNDGVGGISTWYEGGNTMYLTMAANSIDRIDLILWAISSTTYYLFIKNPQINLTKVAGTVTAITDTPAIVAVNANTKPLSSLKSNSVVTVNASGQFVGSDITLNGAQINTNATMINCTVNLFAWFGQIVNFTVAGALTINASLGCVVWLNQSADITSVSVTNYPTTGLARITLIRIKDNNATPRNITWGAGWTSESPLTPTQVANGRDIFIINVFDGSNTFFVTQFQNFKQKGT